jgi:hypothetical protein
MKQQRRDFLTAALAAAGSPALWAAMPAATRPDTLFAQAHSLTIVFDERLPDSRAFAFRARAMGARTGARIVPMGNDIGLLWFQSLAPANGAPPDTLAGLTRHADAFLLARLALGIGMQVTRQAADTHTGPDALVMWRLDPPSTCSLSSLSRLKAT